MPAEPQPSPEDVERLRARIHEAVDECQRRYAKYVSRCADFDQWSAWARQRFEEQGSNYWSSTSQADRLVIMSIIAERDEALAALVSAGRLRSLDDQELADAARGLVGLVRLATAGPISPKWVSAVGRVEAALAGRIRHPGGEKRELGTVPETSRGWVGAWQPAEEPPDAPR